ncbi:hypothetical protein 0305phi8-36p085 [Bacillus phage 0305phi8-36]|uniref:hypothetical protein n=1 Tax=Bacillus phage 0305phi8-36 TaxID=458639 RepID=UPI00015A1FB1|nr:hypothetical protein ST0305phi8-36p085 [Bacillus phage 0305phi8-36]ABS83645.1 hypothetical protein 0305phi8-36p085 [Bacillus phage 0305phi8-36]
MLKELLGAILSPFGGPRLTLDRPVKDQVREQLEEEIVSEIGHGTVLIDLLVEKGLITEAELDAAVEAKKVEARAKIEELMTTDPNVIEMLEQLEAAQENAREGKCSCGKPLGHDDEDGEEEGTPVDEATVTQEKIVH